MFENKSKPTNTTSTNPSKIDLKSNNSLKSKLSIFEKHEPSIKESDPNKDKNDNTRQNVKKFSNIFESKKPEEKEKEKKEFNNSKKLEFEDFYEENGMKIYRYYDINKYHFKNAIDNKNCKILLFMGNNQIPFINSFINMYQNISPNDNIRYSIESKDNQENENLKKIFSVYDIKSKIKPKNNELKSINDIKIISIPYFGEKNEIFINYETLNVFIEKINNNNRKMINSIFFTLDETKKDFKEYEKNFFKLIINLFNSEDLKDKFIVLYKSDNDNNTPDNLQNCQEILKNFMKVEYNDYLSNENYDLYSNLNPRYISLNNNLIFQKDQNLEFLDKNMQIIYKIIFGCKSTTLTEKIDIYKDLQKITKGTIKKELEKKIMKKNDQIIFLNYILDKENIINEQSDVILFLYNILNQSEPKQKSININDSDLEFINNKDANKALKILSKLNLSLNKIHIENCNLNYNDINFLLNLFTDELIELNLANNNFLDTNIFNKGGIYTNLQYFNLSCNNIENIDSLFTLDFPNLKELDLSNNKISDIKSISFKKCEKLQKLNLIGNMISKGLDEAANEFNKLSGLSLEYLNIEKIMFEYENISKEKKVFFEYIIDENINDFLANISFHNISKLE